jgi:tetratricopeptide (TPR) repeat protein
VWHYNSSKKEIKNLNLSLSIILLTILASFLITISFPINEVLAVECRDTDKETGDTNNKDANRLLNKGFDFGAIGKDEKALEYFDQALDEDPSYAKALFNKGLALAKLEKDGEAVEYFDQALDEDPNYASAMYAKGLSLQQLGKSEEAIQSLDQAIDEDPNFARAMYAKGLILQSLGKSEEAIQSLDQAIDADPNCDSALETKKEAQEKIDNTNNSIKPVNTPVIPTSSSNDTFVNANQTYASTIDELKSKLADINCNEQEWKNKLVCQLENGVTIKIGNKMIRAPTIDLIKNVSEKSDCINPTTKTEHAFCRISSGESIFTISSDKFQPGFTFDYQNITAPSFLDTNNPPVANNAWPTTNINQPVSIQLSSTDKDNDKLTTEIVSSPSNGTLTNIDQETGVVTYTPNPGFSRADGFTFKVNDGKMDSNIAIVTVTVNHDQQQAEQEQQQISSTTSIADEITKLADLRDRGFITEEEYSQLKLDIIAKSNSGNTKSDGTIISGVGVLPTSGGNLTALEKNTKPTADAGPSTIVNPGEYIGLQGSGFDLDNDPITVYLWDIEDPHASIDFGIMGPNPIIYVKPETPKKSIPVTLKVTDGKDYSERDHTYIHVTGPNLNDVCFAEPIADDPDCSIAAIADPDVKEEDEEKASPDEDIGKSHQEKRAEWKEKIFKKFKEQGIKKTGKKDEISGKEVWSNGKSGKDIEYYTIDEWHGEIEIFNHNKMHKGGQSIDTGSTKPPDPTRKLKF